MINTMKKTSLRLLTMGVLAIPVVLITGCNSMPNIDVFKKHNKISATFDSDGRSSVKDKNNREDFPENDGYKEINEADAKTLIANARRRAQSDTAKGLQEEFSVWRIHGSHYYIALIRGRYYKIELPAPHPN